MTRKTEKAYRGQTIITESGPDRSVPLDRIDADEAVMGRTTKGGPRSLSHSIPGAMTTDYFDKK